jgi:uncharacterized protein (DUF58 family)
MKTVMKLLLLALFALIIFMPTDQIPRWMYWSLFILLFGVLYLYYRISYWVPLSAVQRTISQPVTFSLFVGKVPPMNSEDLVRGRLVITESDVQLYQMSRKKGQEHQAKLVWQVPIEEIKRFSIGRVIGLRNGITFHLADGDESKFVASSIRRHKQELIHALGWDENQIE